MAAAIPLIRGFALYSRPCSWLADDAVLSIERALAAVDLSLSPIADPFRPIPLTGVAALLRNAAREHGAGSSAPNVARSSSLEIAMLGKVALGARTPGEALTRIVTALPYYCSHEQVSFEKKAANIRAGVLRSQARPGTQHRSAIRHGLTPEYTVRGRPSKRSPIESQYLRGRSMSARGILGGWAHSARMALKPPSRRSCPSAPCGHGSDRASMLARLLTTSTAEIGANPPGRG